ncbi:hypothetical protein B0T16DRAFT_423913 [Cercophora newfieldiana]|uniref:Uncharacterized protein n=1 Tax=Cercophora newfieldiana TaxID=92897 RepID=A0AA39XTF6_9PEZI|nr:hypothetical protein B0T16DRAFT_423913 [Cercophora newfieldiana]
MLSVDATAADAYVPVTNRHPLHPVGLSGVLDARNPNQDLSRDKRPNDLYLVMGMRVGGTSLMQL